MTSNIFPAIGQIYEARFGDLAFHLKFHDDGKTMQFAPAASADFATAEAVIYHAVAIRPGVFMVTWTEADKTTVTHVEDFETGQVHTNITRPDHTFLNLLGSWKKLT
ncbi:MoaF-related domain-containing protein [Rhizobium freirei]|uniref:MoaF-related domain-containing protein n=1 Tax=Rhizobium freirei TaxID=1353277 RepID=UPI0003A9AA27|nr:MoaF N-terminal domain-containing protein [Rhizobium freirei]